MILNMTQHVATAQQLEAGVVEPDAQTKAQIRRLMTFDDDKPPTRREIGEAAQSLAQIAKATEARTVMIGGAPWLMPALARALKEEGLDAVGAYSKRTTKQIPGPDGPIMRNVFEHAGFVEMEYAEERALPPHAEGDHVWDKIVEDGRKELTLNMTYHPATAEQAKNGVIEPDPKTKEKIRELLTFDGDKPPTKREIEKAAQSLAKIACDSNRRTVMIGAAPWFAPALTQKLNAKGIEVVAAYSKRVSEEEHIGETVVKKSRFKHLGLVGMGSSMHTRERRAGEPMIFPARIDGDRVWDEYVKAGEGADGRREEDPPINWWLKKHVPHFAREFKVVYGNRIVHRDSLAECGRYVRDRGRETALGERRYATPAGNALLEARGITLQRWEPGPGPHDPPRSTDRPRMDIAPEPCKSPGLRSLAQRQGFHYVEGWPVLELRPALGQPEETIVCKAMAIGPNGVMLVRDAKPEEIPARDDAQIANEARNLRIESAIRAQLPGTLSGLIEASMSKTIRELPIHILTTGTNDLCHSTGYLRHCRHERCIEQDDGEISRWFKKVNDVERLQGIEDDVRDALLPTLKTTQKRADREQALAFAVGAGPNPGAKDRPQLAEEAQELRRNIECSRRGKPFQQTKEDTARKESRTTSRNGRET